MKILQAGVVYIVLLNVALACVPTERTVVRIDGMDRHYETSSPSRQPVDNQAQAAQTVPRQPSSSTSGLTAIMSNPETAASQALAICEPRARAMASGATSERTRNSGPSSATCIRGSTGNYFCNETGNAGGFSGGFYGGLADGLARRRLQGSFLDSCLAEYGWRK